MNETIDATALIAPNSRVFCERVVRNVGQRPVVGGEDVDVGLDALIGVVDRVVDETGPVVRLAVEPVAGEAVGQPGAPREAEPLHQEHVDHDPGDVDGGQDARRRSSRSQKPSLARCLDRVVAAARPPATTWKRSTCRCCSS